MTNCPYLLPAAWLPAARYASRHSARRPGRGSSPRPARYRRSLRPPVEEFLFLAMHDRSGGAATVDDIFLDARRTRSPHRSMTGRWNSSPAPQQRRDSVLRAGFDPPALLFHLPGCVEVAHPAVHLADECQWSRDAQSILGLVDRYRRAARARRYSGSAEHGLCHEFQRYFSRGGSPCPAEFCSASPFARKTLAAMER